MPSIVIPGLVPQRQIILGEVFELDAELGQYVKVAKTPLRPLADEVHRLKHEVLPLILYRGKTKVKYEDAAWDWLANLSASEAFLYAICEGPWKQDRIEKIRKRVMAVAGKKDLSNILPVEIDHMQWPLSWQKSHVTHITKYLRGTGQAMSDFARNLKGQPPEKAIDIFYKACGAKNRTKTLDLFARDHLHIDTIPIDRHVRRVLQHFNFPADEKYMIKLAYKAGIKPRFLARLLVAFAFTGKPFQSAPKKGL